MSQRALDQTETGGAASTHASGIQERQLRSELDEVRRDLQLVSSERDALNQRVALEVHSLRQVQIIYS